MSLSSQSYLLLILFLQSSVKSIENIRFVFEMSRHGVASPSLNSTSDYKDSFGEQWTGVNELSLVGLRQQYVLGYFNRLRYTKYNKLLNEKYDPRDIYIIANNKNCTIQSANAQLQGLYPPKTAIVELTEKQQANANPPNDPKDAKYYETERIALGNSALPDKMHLMPVHAFYLQDHTYELQDPSYCPSAVNMSLNKENSEEGKGLIKTFKNNFGDKILALIGKIDKNAFDNYSFTKSIIETIIAQKADGRSMSRFTTVGIDIESLLSFCNNFIIFDNSKGYDTNQLKELSQYAMSPTFRKIVDWITVKVTNDLAGKMDIITYSSPKFVLYLTYAPSMIIFQKFLHLLSDNPLILQNPIYSSSAVIELISLKETPSTEEDYVLSYRFDNKEIYRISYTEFITKAKQLIMSEEQIKEYCGWKELIIPFNYWIIIIIALSVISLSIIIGMAYMIVKKKTLNNNLL